MREPGSATRVAMLSGGPSAERGVSRVSADAVKSALANEADLELHDLELDENVVQALLAINPDVVLPILHGPPGEDGTLQGLLELMQLPYVGSGVGASALAMDKLASKGVFNAVDLPTADFSSIHRRVDEANLSSKLDQIVQSLGERLVIKPTHQGSALGVTRISEAAALTPAVQAALMYGDTLLIEQWIEGKEMTVGVLDTHGTCEAFPVIEIQTPEASWYDFNHRYTEGASSHLMPAPISDTLTAQLQSAAIKAHQALGCRDLSRTDFIVSEDSFVVLEVNTMPGMTPTSLYPEGAMGAGVPFTSLLRRLMDAALNRPPNGPWA